MHEKEGKEENEEEEEKEEKANLKEVKKSLAGNVERGVLRRVEVGFDEHLQDRRGPLVVPYQL